MPIGGIVMRKIDFHVNEACQYYNSVYIGTSDYIGVKCEDL